MFLAQLPKLVNIIKEFDIPSYLSSNDTENKNDTNIPIKKITLKLILTGA